MRPRRILILVCRSGNILDDNLWEGESPSVQPFENGVHLRFRAPVRKLGRERYKFLSSDCLRVEVGQLLALPRHVELNVLEREHWTEPATPKITVNLLGHRALKPTQFVAIIPGGGPEVPRQSRKSLPRDHGPGVKGLVPFLAERDAEEKPNRVVVDGRDPCHLRVRERQLPTVQPRRQILADGVAHSALHAAQNIHQLIAGDGRGVELRKLCELYCRNEAVHRHHEVRSKSAVQLLDHGFQRELTVFRLPCEITKLLGHARYVKREPEEPDVSRTQQHPSWVCHVNY